MIFLLTVSFASAINCNPDMSVLNVTDYDMDNVAGLKSLIGNGKDIELKIDDATFYYRTNDGIISKIDEIDKTDKLNYIVSSDKCTLERVLNGSDPLAEYKDDHITIEANGITSNIRAMIAKIGATIFGWFR